MKRYEVICIAVGGKGNNVFKHGEIVTEDQFLPDHADSYVKTGHLKLKKLTAKEKAADEAKEKADADYVEALKVFRTAQEASKTAEDKLNKADHEVRVLSKTKLTNDTTFETAEKIQEEAVAALTSTEEAKSKATDVLSEAESEEKELPKNASKAKKAAAVKAITTAKESLSEAETAVTEAQSRKDNADAAFDSAKSIQAETIKALGKLQQDLDDLADLAEKASDSATEAEEAFNKANTAKAKAYQ